MSEEGERIARLEEAVDNLKGQYDKILNSLTKLQYWIMGQLVALLLLIVGKVI